MHSYGARPLRSVRRMSNLAGSLPGWYSIRNQSGLNVVSIYDEIGFLGVPAGQFLDELSAVKGDIELHLNSPGGDIWDGLTIYNRLKQRKDTISVVIDGLAASAASFIAQAASPGKLEMAPHSQMMIHNGFGMAIGDANDMRKMADLLESTTAEIAGVYADRTGKPASHWLALMAQETWFKDHEAVAEGLADRITGQDDRPGNRWDLSVYRNQMTPEDEQLATEHGHPGEACWDPDGDGDCDLTPQADTDHDYWAPDGTQLKPVPGKPMKQKKNKQLRKVRNADVDHSAWDSARAWHNGANADNPESFYRAICAAEKTSGDPATQAHWALPYRYTPDSAPNAGGVRAAWAAFNGARGGVDDLADRDKVHDKLVGLMKKVNPDWSPDDQFDSGLLGAVLTSALIGG